MKQKNNDRLSLFIWITFIAFALWWLYINVFVRAPLSDNIHYKLFGATYGVMSLIGGCIGLAASRKWGSHKSMVGRALLFFSIGLLLQAFGQVAYSFYVYVLKVDIPYPSVGDVGYFGSVLLYIYAAWELSKALGFKLSVKNKTKKFIAVAVPLVLLSGSYYYFLRGYAFDFSSLKASLTVILDFGYPLGQAVYIAIAIMTYLLSRKMLGGVMKNKVLLVLFALVVQYTADSSFLYAAKAEKFFASGANDFMYLLSYTVMALALTTFRGGFTKPVEAPTTPSGQSSGE